MKHHERICTELLSAVVLVLTASLMGLSGCATRSDMDQFQHTLTQRLDLMTSSLQADTRRLQGQLEAQSKRQQELARLVDAMKSNLENEVHAIRNELGSAVEELVSSETARTQMMKELRQESTQLRKALDDYAVKTHQELGRIEAVAQDGSKDIRHLEQSLAAFSIRLEQLPSLVTRVGSELHSLSQALLGGYRLEEAALRERLKSVEQVLKQLEPTPLQAMSATTPAAPQTNKAASHSSGPTGFQKP